MGDPYPGKIKFEGGTPLVISYEAVVASLAIGGWPQSLWATGAAVIAQESNKTVNIYNTYLDGHYGLMQIGKQQHPDFFKSGSTLWVVPWLNCQEGYKIYQSQGWGAWEGHSNGRYAGFLLQAKAAVSSVAAKKAKSSLSDAQFYLSLYGKNKDGFVALAGLQGSGADIGSVLGAGASASGQAVADTGTAVIQTAKEQASGIVGVAQLVLGAAKWLGDAGNWLRIGQVVVGGGLVLAGLSIVSKPAANQVVKAASAVAPVGRVAKKVVSTAGKAAA